MFEGVSPSKRGAVEKSQTTQEASQRQFSCRGSIGCAYSPDCPKEFTNESILTSEMPPS
jgi:hypothetical protein